MPLSDTALALVALLLAAWTIAAGALILTARARLRRGEAAGRRAERLERLIEQAPAVPLIVWDDDTMEPSPRLAGWLGLSAAPERLTDLAGDGAGLEPEALAAVADALARTRRAARSFKLSVQVHGRARPLVFRGEREHPTARADGAVLVWVSEPTDPVAPAAPQADGVTALAALIDASLTPMWLRDSAGALQRVNRAYADAVGAEPAAIVAGQIELLEPESGRATRDIALDAVATGTPAERTVAATVAGERRSLRVTDVPLGGFGIVGHAFDVQEQEEIARTLRAFQQAQRSVLECLSAGVARFDAQHRLASANTAFLRIFALGADVVQRAPRFERLLDSARDAGRLPEVRDYPEWRRERLSWFASSGACQEDWPLASGVHLRVVAQPQPDGGLLLAVEDRSEPLQLSAARDTLLRTRTATFDSLFEAVALFAPDGRLDQWNRRFGADWNLEGEFLDTHPQITVLMQRIAAQLKRPADAAAVADAVRAATLERRQTGGRMQLADGRVLAYAGVPLPDGNGLLTVIDMTDAIKAEEALRQRNAALQEADAVKARFLVELSAEFRMPLDVIGGFAERLRDGIGGDLDEVGRDYVVAILASVERIGENIDRLLLLSRAEAGVLPDARGDIVLRHLAHQLIEERRALLDDGGVTVAVEGGTRAAQVRVSGDRDRLARAVGSLLDRAIAAAARGGHIRIELSRHRGPAGERARLIVHDVGDATIGPSEAGGEDELALPLARELIVAQGGTLDLVSEPGRGTAAIVELP